MLLCPVRGARRESNTSGSWSMTLLSGVTRDKKVSCDASDDVLQSPIQELVIKANIHDGVETCLRHPKVSACNLPLQDLNLDTINGGIDGDEWFESKMVCNALTISPSGESITVDDDDVDDDVVDAVDGIASLPPASDGISSSSSSRWMRGVPTFLLPGVVATSREQNSHAWEHNVLL